MAEPRNQAGQQRHPQRKLSRRIVMAGMAVTGALVTGGGGLLWWEFIPHPLYTSQRHPGAVYTVAWSPDGTRLASGNGDGTIQVWEAN